MVAAEGGLNLIPQIGQVQYIQDTENGQIIHYQLHDQYEQILQQDPGQTQVNKFLKNHGMTAKNRVFLSRVLLKLISLHSCLNFCILGDCNDSRRCSTRNTLSTHRCHYTTGRWQYIEKYNLGM